MKPQSFRYLLKAPLSVILYYLFEKYRNKHGNRILSTNTYKKIAKMLNKHKLRRQIKFRNGVLNDFLLETDSKLESTFMQDGWHLSGEFELPHSREAVLVCKKLFRSSPARQGNVHMPYTISGDKELLSYGEINKFVFSNEMLRLAASYLGVFPTLASVGLVRSDPITGVWSESQLMHLDVIDEKVFRVILNVTTMDDENGPFTFYPLDVSRQILEDDVVDYGAPGQSLNIKDEELPIYAKGKEIKVSGEVGQALFVDTCRCFHFGSRALSRSRCVLMLSFAGCALQNLRGAVGLDYKASPETGDSRYVKIAKNNMYVE